MQESRQKYEVTVSGEDAEKFTVLMEGIGRILMCGMDVDAVYSYCGRAPERRTCYGPQVPEFMLGGRKRERGRDDAGEKKKPV